MRGQLDRCELRDLRGAVPGQRDQPLAVQVHLTPPGGLPAAGHGVQVGPLRGDHQQLGRGCQLGPAGGAGPVQHRVGAGLGLRPGLDAVLEHVFESSRCHRQSPARVPDLWTTGGLDKLDHRRGGWRASRTTVGPQPGSGPSSGAMPLPLPRSLPHAAYHRDAVVSTSSTTGAALARLQNHRRPTTRDPGRHPAPTSPRRGVLPRHPSRAARRGLDKLDHRRASGAPPQPPPNYKPASRPQPRDMPLPAALSPCHLPRQCHGSTSSTTGAALARLRNHRRTTSPRADCNPASYLSPLLDHPTATTTTLGRVSS